MTSTETPDWTVHDGRSNSSPEFHAITAVIEDIIRSSAHTLISGRADTVAGTILATLAHKEGLRPGGAAGEAYRARTAQQEPPRWAVETAAESLVEAGHGPFPEDGDAGELGCIECSDAKEGFVPWPCPVALVASQEVRDVVLAEYRSSRKEPRP